MAGATMLRYGSTVAGVQPHVVCLLAVRLHRRWIWYNTKVLNRVIGPKTLSAARPTTRKLTSNLKNNQQPRVRSVKYAIDVFPSRAT